MTILNMQRRIRRKMGYSHRLYLIEKEKIDRIHHFAKDEFYQWGLENDLVELNEEIEDEEPYLPLYRIGEEFFDFGKYYDNVKDIHKNGKPLFQDEELYDSYEHYQPHIVSKEAVLNAIEFQKGLIVKMYEDMLFKTDEERMLKDYDDRTKEEMYRQHIQSMYSEWKSKFMKNGCFAINLDDRTPSITTSWKYEYSIFELVRLYKYTDWEKYDLLFMGW